MSFGKIMAMAMGLCWNTSDTCYQVSKKLRGGIGLIYSTKEEVNEWFKKYMEVDFAWDGNKIIFIMGLDPMSLEQFSPPWSHSWGMCQPCHLTKRYESRVMQTPEQA